ncbi:DUF2188 domain-containing protein [Halodesulfovibrio spirochaetisodalis]|uniref:DUF2188 domain-containing protein n=1 Tax=Halodesulfovibrio spirochaetisodalis TaxID=1560234 RepID=A0A1B7XEU2_9BACT|nr:DUF2188 domain-containing protein [Halodesulfovibrio spirochaetisodalis]OBQ52708.1 hypothetical protein SP90_07015 [Halodesulfovibrio spirochaetisodalis]
MKRTTYFVRPYDGKWKVKKEGAEREFCTCATRVEGLQIARELAGDSAPAQIIIEKEDGTIVQEWVHSNHSVWSGNKLEHRSGRNRLRK